MTQRPAGFKKSLKKAFFIIVGSIFLGLGALGMVLPGLPTTPFLLAAAACYCRGSERMHRWLLNNKWFGKYIRNYREGRGMSARSKVFTLASLWITIGISAYLLREILVVHIILVVVAVAVSVHILRLPTFRPSI